MTRTKPADRLLDAMAGIGAKKKQATATARGLGHKLGIWKRRAGDRYGRQDAHCTRCYAVATVAVEAPTVYELPDIYGAALTVTCNGRT